MTPASTARLVNIANRCPVISTFHNGVGLRLNAVRVSGAMVPVPGVNMQTGASSPRFEMRNNRDYFFGAFLPGVASADLAEPAGAACEVGPICGVTVLPIAFCSAM